MGLKRLHSFLVLAEELHFGRAADRIGVTQPSLSQQIARLEADLGAVLFERTSRRVQLTPAGTAFLPGARRAVIEAQRAARAARDAASGGAGELLIGTIGSALNGILPGLLREFTGSNRQVRIDIRQLDTADQLTALLDRRLDVGFVRSAQPTAALTVLPIDEEPFVAVLPADHRLAAQAELALGELAGEPFVLWPRRASTGFYDAVIAMCAEHGFSPRVHWEAAGAETLLGLIAAGVGVSIQPASYANLGRAGVVFRPLAGSVATSTLQVAHRRGAPDPVLARFLSVVEGHRGLTQAAGAAHRSARTTTGG